MIVVSYLTVHAGGIIENGRHAKRQALYATRE
jgi:hypothetical protein